MSRAAVPCRRQAVARHRPCVGEEGPRRKGIRAPATVGGVRIWALSDLHLSLAADKPMDVFGDHWRAHHDTMAAAWDRVVDAGDVVLTPGDFSWAMKAEDSAADFAWLARRPGRKVLVKGNHDLWWPKTRKGMRALLPACTYAIKKNGVVLEGDGARLGLFGCRGGDFKASPQYGDTRSEDDIEGWLAREERELRSSLDALRQLENGVASDLRICLFHYPPIPPAARSSRFTPLIEEGGAALCVYGHLHGERVGPARVEGRFGGVGYVCASCDLLGFEPLLLGELTADGWALA